MSELMELQQSFSNALGSRSQEAPFLASLLGDSETNKEILAIYRGNLQANIHTALLIAYPVLEQQLGAECFSELARLSWRLYPPERFELNIYGAHIPDLIASRQEFAEYPWLPDLARLEWAVHRAGMCADQSATGFAVLAALSPAQLAATVLQLQDAARLVDSRWPILSIWQQHQSDETRQSDLASRASESVLIYRKGHLVETMIASRSEACLIQAITAGMALEAALHEVAEQYPESDPAGALNKLFSTGLIVSISGALR